LYRRRHHQRHDAQLALLSLLPVVAIIVVPMLPPPLLPVSPLPDGRCYRRQCGLCFHGCCHLPATMVMTCCSKKGYFSLHSTQQKDYFSEEACINGEKVGTTIRVSACLRICVSAYLRICVSAYLRICVSAYLKKKK